MASLKYTRNDVLTMCQNLGLTITTEDALGCVAKKDNVIYRFEYITRPVKPKKQIESKVEEEETPSITKPKRKPRKTKVTEESTVESVVEEKKPSKRRGRPRKTKVTKESTTEPIVEVSENEVIVAPKKRRGRRSKAEIAAAKAAEAED